MSQVRLVRVLRTTQDTKYGIKPKLAIKTDQHGDKWLSSFKMAGTEGWNEGDTVTIDIQEKGDFLNFTPSGTTSSGSATSNTSGLEARVEKLEAEVFGTKADTIADADLPSFGDDEEEDDTGF